MAQQGKAKTFYMPYELYEWLSQAAEEDGRTVSNFLQYIIRDYIRRH